MTIPFPFINFLFLFNALTTTDWCFKSIYWNQKSHPCSKFIYSTTYLTSPLTASMYLFLKIIRFKLKSLPEHPQPCQSSLLFFPILLYSYITSSYPTQSLRLIINSSATLSTSNQTPCSLNTMSQNPLSLPLCLYPPWFMSTYHLFDINCFIFTFLKILN